MPDCPICEHPQREAIDHDMHAGVDAAVLAVRYRVRKAFIEMHAGHLMESIKEPQAFYAMNVREDLPTHAFPETSMDALQPALPHIRRASRLVKSYDEYQALVVEINDALCDGIRFVHELLKQDDMGL